MFDALLTEVIHILESPSWKTTEQDNFRLHGIDNTTTAKRILSTTLKAMVEWLEKHLFAIEEGYRLEGYWLSVEDWQALKKSMEE